MRLKAPPLELETDDRALARRMLAGDEEAFEVFFDARLPGLYRFAMARLRDPDLTRELVQTSICKAIAHLDSFRGEASLTSWLYTICRNEIGRHFKKLKRAPEELALPEDHPEARGGLDSLATSLAEPEKTLDPEQTLERGEVARLVHATLDHLPPHYGRALEWKYIDGLSVKEIARRLEVAPKAAESILTRARAAFRDGYASTTKAPLVPLVRGAS